MSSRNKCPERLQEQCTSQLDDSFSSDQDNGYTEATEVFGLVECPCHFCDPEGELLAQMKPQPDSSPANEDETKEIASFSIESSKDGE